MQQQFSVAITCTNDFSFIRLIDEIVWDRRSTCSELGCAGTLDADAVQQTHSGVHLETEIRDVRRSSFLKVLHQSLRYINWKLARSVLLPFRRNAFGIEGRKLLLDPVLELKIQSYFPVAVVVSAAMFQHAAVTGIDRSGLAGADVSAIAATAGVVRGTFYFHFPTKEHVVVELERAEEAKIVAKLDTRTSEVRRSPCRCCPCWCARYLPPSGGWVRWSFGTCWGCTSLRHGLSRTSWVSIRWPSS